MKKDTKLYNKLVEYFDNHDLMYDKTDLEINFIAGELMEEVLGKTF